MILPQQVQPQTQQPPVKHHDRDGVPPGLDLELVGKKFALRFYGIFFPIPSAGPVQLFRLVTIIFASKEVYVAVDNEDRQTLYVVTRHDNLSLGCRMNAELLPVERHRPGLFPV